MIQQWFDDNIFLYIILGICGVGFFIKFVLSMKYRLLIRASKRMGTSKNRLMRLLRLKFETCYKLNIGVNNVDTFVDKYVYRYRFCGFLLYTWETISGEIVILSVLAGSIFSILGLLERLEIDDILSTLIAGVLGALVLISYDFFINLNMKRKVLKINIRDYLENFLKARLENGEFSSDLLEQYKQEYLQLPENQKNKKNKNKKNEEQSIPGLVAQIESAATTVDLVSVREKKAEHTLIKAEEEFDDAQLFMNTDAVEKKAEDKKEEQKGSSKKDKSKKKLKPEEEAELRRLAKKNELKKMIQEDKETRHITMPEFFTVESTARKEESKNTKTEDQAHTTNPFSREAAQKTGVKEKEVANVSVVKKDIPSSQVKKETNKAQGAVKVDESAQRKAISNEEAQIIEDILREYLA